MDDVNLNEHDASRPEDEPCSECGHRIAVHGDEGCNGCTCPFLPSDLLPMTPEQVAWAAAQRR